MQPILSLETLAQGGNKLTVKNEVSTFETTYLTQDYSSGVTVLNIDNALDFSRAYLLIGAIGTENAEIVTITSQTNTTVTISTTKFAHSRGELVSAILYNQIQFDVSGDGISFSHLGTSNIQVTDYNTITLDQNTNFYYRCQYIGSGIGSSYSDTVGIAQTTTSAYGIISQALKLAGISFNDPSINMTFLLAALNEARRKADNVLYGYQFDWRNVMQYPIPLLAGSDNVVLPNNIDFKENNRSVLRARIGSTNTVYSAGLQYVSKQEFNMLTINRYNHNIVQTINIGDTLIYLDRVVDMQSSGTLYIQASSPEQTMLVVPYTAKDIVLNTVTVASTAITRTLYAGMQAWSFPIITYPLYYTVYDGKMFFESVIPNTLGGKVILLDYYSKLEDVTNITYELPEHYRYAYVDYLSWRIKKLRDKTVNEKDDDYQNFVAQLNVLKNNMYTGQYGTII